MDPKLFHETERFEFFSRPINARPNSAELSLQVSVRKLAVDWRTSVRNMPHKDEASCNNNEEDCDTLANPHLLVLWLRVPMDLQTPLSNLIHETWSNRSCLRMSCHFSMAISSSMILGKIEFMPIFLTVNQIGSADHEGFSLIGGAFWEQLLMKFTMTHHVDGSSEGDWAHWWTSASGIGTRRKFLKSDLGWELTKMFSLVELSLRQIFGEQVKPD